MSEPNSSKYAIDAHNRGIKEIKDLSKLPQLRALDVSFNQLSSIKNIQTAKDLRELKIYHNKLTSTSGLRWNNALESIYLHENAIEEISDDFKYLTKLKVLWLNGNRIRSAGNLSACIHLVHLDLSRNRLEGVASLGLESLVCLEYLDLSNNHLTRIGDFSSLSKLEELSLANNRLNDATGQFPQSLTTLRLNGNQLKQLGSFGPLRNLNELYVHANMLKDLSSLSQQCPVLESLDLRNNSFNQINDLLGSFAKCASLKDLWVEGNPCCHSPTYVLDIVRALPDLQTVDGWIDEQLKQRVKLLELNGDSQSNMDRPRSSEQRPTTPRLPTPLRPTTSSIGRPSSGGSRPGTPPVLHRPSSRTGSFSRLADPQEIERSQQLLQENFRRVKQLIHCDDNKKAEFHSTSSRPSADRSFRRDKQSKAIKEVSVESEARDVHQNKVVDELKPQRSVASEMKQSASIELGMAHTNPKASTRQKRSKTLADVGTDPFDGLDVFLPRDNPKKGNQTDNQDAEIQATLPPVPVKVSNVPLMNLEEPHVELTLEKEMKQHLLQSLEGENQASEPSIDMISPRVESNRRAEKRQPPNPSSKRGYRSFRLPVRTRTS